MDADVIVVGGGLAGLVATAELADAGRRVILLDQEPKASLGGQAFWSFGGLFLVDTPEQRRLRVKDSVDLAWQDWEASAEFDRDEDHWGTAVGARLCRVRRRREAFVVAPAGHALVPRRWVGRARGLRRHRPRQLRAPLPHHVGYRARDG